MYKIILFTDLFEMKIFVFNYNRVDKVKVQYLYGHRATVVIIRILVIVMDTQTVYILYLFQV